MQAPTQTQILVFICQAKICSCKCFSLIILLGMEMQTKTLVRVFIGSGREGGWDLEPILRLTLAVAESYRNIDYRLPFNYGYLSSSVCQMRL